MAGEPMYEKECVYFTDDDCLQSVRVVHGAVVAPLAITAYLSALSPGEPPTTTETETIS